MRIFPALLVSFSIICCGPEVWAQTAPRPQGFTDKAFGPTLRGGADSPPAFMVRLAVNHEDRNYHDGDSLIASVQSEKDGYLYLYYIQSDGGQEKCWVLYPNDFDRENLIDADRAVTVPTQNTYDLKCIAPYGPGRLFALVTRQSLTSVKAAASRVGPKEIHVQELRTTIQEAQRRKPEDFAEVFLDIKTFGQRSELQDEKQKLPRRVAVCIGISDFADPKVRDLTVSHHDGELMAQSLKASCAVDQVVLLTNSQATRRAIEKAIYEDLPAQTRVGDTVFIFFSGHGGRCADTNGDEADGLDEFLVPHDGILGKEETMILDDVFARWMQQLEGRKVCIMLDSCHSGGTTKGFGSAQGRKGVASPAVDVAADRTLNVDFLDGEVNRAKDLGQKDTQIIAACQATQLAWEMLPPNQESVLTHYLLDAIAKKSASDADGDGKLRVVEAFKFVESSIQQYVKDKIQTDQTPLLIDNADGQILLVP